VLSAGRAGQHLGLADADDARFERRLVALLALAQRDEDLREVFRAQAIEEILRDGTDGRRGEGEGSQRGAATLCSRSWFARRSDLISDRSRDGTTTTTTTRGSAEAHHDGFVHRERHLAMPPRSSRRAAASSLADRTPRARELTLTASGSAELRAEPRPLATTGPLAATRGETRFQFDV
jgi:hypothetical protein